MKIQRWRCYRVNLSARFSGGDAKFISRSSRRFLKLWQLTAAQLYYSAIPMFTWKRLEMQMRMNLKICWHRLTCGSMFRIQHTAGGCLDLVITQSEVKVMDPLVSNIGFSDHCLVTCQLLVNLLEVDPIPVEGRKWKGFSVKSSTSDLSKSALWGELSWTLSASVDELFDRYSCEMSNLLNLHAPRCWKCRKKHLLTPWIYDGCTAFKRSTHRLKKKYRRTRQDDDRKEWIASLKKQLVYFRKKEQLYWSARICRKCWCLLQSIRLYVKTDLPTVMT